MRIRQWNIESFSKGRFLFRYPVLDNPRQRKVQERIGRLSQSLARVRKAKRLLDPFSAL
jgi:hypothetical protein